MFFFLVHYHIDYFSVGSLLLSQGSRQGQRKKNPQDVECVVYFGHLCFIVRKTISQVSLRKMSFLQQSHLHDIFDFSFLYCALKVLSAHWTSMSVSHIPVRMEAPALTNWVITTADVLLHSKVMKTEGVG